MSLEQLPPLREVIRAHDLAARKSLGQNFLLDLNLTGRIARSAGPLEGVTVVEVGPGPGGLTRALLAEGAAKVIAIEKDRRCIAALNEIGAACPGRLEVVEGDALNPGAFSPPSAPARIVANLPYNVATPLLTGWITKAWPAWWDSLTLMFQREVAERIVAEPGSRTYGRLSVLCQWRCEARMLFDVSPAAFTPPPKVTSTIVQLVPRADAAKIDPPLLERVTAAAFGQRRKMLRSSLKQLTPNPLGLLEAAGIDPSLRAENVPVEGFVALARNSAAFQA